jgi:hypothetical protein
LKKKIKIVSLFLENRLKKPEKQHITLKISIKNIKNKYFVGLKETLDLHKKLTTQIYF